MKTILAYTALSRLLSRRLLRAWGRHGKAFGYFYQAMESWGKDLGSSRSIPAKLPNGLTVNCDLHDHVQRHIYYQGVYEPIESYLFSRLLQPGMTVVDAGANIGQYSLLASTRIGPSGTVYAFEPVPKNLKRLINHLIINSVTNVRANNVGLWHEDTTIELGVPGDQTGNDGSFSVGGVRDTLLPAVIARAVRLDHFLTEQKCLRVDLIKMDIEGSELFALQGMQAILERDRPILLVEINESASTRMGYDTKECWKFLVGQLGYRAWRIGHSASDWRLLESLDDIAQANCLFTPADLPASIASDWTFRKCLRWAGSAGRKEISTLS
jgi:FkbM family methyltransferase